MLKATTNGPDVTASARVSSGLEHTKFARREGTPANDIHPGTAAGAAAAPDFPDPWLVVLRFDCVRTTSLEDHGPSLTPTRLRTRGPNV